MSNLVQKFQEYSEWRKGVARALEQYRAWIGGSDMADAAADQRLSRLMERLVDDKLSIAFVAEFSRGKSELINAIFFAGPSPTPAQSNFRSDSYGQWRR